MTRKKSDADLHKTTHYITPGQDVFLKRKVRELRQRVSRQDEELVTESTIIQGLLSMYMAADAKKESS